MAVGALGGSLLFDILSRARRSVCGALAFALLLVVGFPTLATADEPWLGERVFWRIGAEARDGDKDNVGETKIELEKVPFPATVRSANGEWLWLEKAWVRKADLMLAEEALDYYTDRAKKEPKVASNWRGGTVWLAKGKWDYAIKNLSEAIKLDPDDPVSYVNTRPPGPPRAISTTRLPTMTKPFEPTPPTS